MNSLATSPRLTPATSVRWIARFLSVPILLVWGFFIFAHLLGDEGAPSRPLIVDDYILLAMMGVWLVGLVVAWKWELAGGTMTLMALAVAACFNWRVLTFPGVLVAMAAVLFLSSWWLHRLAADVPAARTIHGS